MTRNLKPTKLSLAVNKAGSTGFKVDTSNDDQLFDGSQYSWDELRTLKEELGKGVLEFTAQVSSIVQNKDITANLGGQMKHFTDTVNLFFTEITDFSEKVRVNRMLHEDKSGPVKDMDEFSLYNRVAITYHTLCNELAILVGPIVSELMIIVSKVVDLTRQDEQPATEEENGNAE